MIVNYSEMLTHEWNYLREHALQPLETFLTTGNKEVMFTKKEYMQFYTKVYELCI